MHQCTGSVRKDHVTVWDGMMACIAAMYVVTFLLTLNRYMSDHIDSAVSPPVTCVDTVTVHLHSQCSGACSDVQETAEVQS